MEIALLSLVAWGILIFARGGFWRADQRLPSDLSEPSHWPDVAVVIPARDEAATIAEVVSAHGATDYPGQVRIFVVDDGSTDGTGDLAREAAQDRGVTVIPAPSLAPEWTGKLWALHNGILAARSAMPSARWLLLTDADIVHAPQTLQALVRMGEARNLALVSLMARLDARGFWGSLLIPAFIFFFQKLYPFAWANDPAKRLAAAAGGCVLIRREALEAIGGIGAIRGALIDDCSLAALIKAGPPRRQIWLGLARHEVESRRDNRALNSIWHMVSRTAFTQLGYSALALAGTVAGMVFLYLVPPIAVVWGLLDGDVLLSLAGIAAWGAMAAAYRPTVLDYGKPLWMAFTLPLAGALYAAMTLDSAIRHWRGAGGAWKGRVYARPRA